MNNKLKVGDIAYLVENNRYVSEGKIARISGDLITFIFISGKGGTRVNANGLFATEESALAAIKKSQFSYDHHFRAIMS